MSPKRAPFRFESVSIAVRDGEVVIASTDNHGRLWFTTGDRIEKDPGDWDELEPPDEAAEA